MQSQEYDDNLVKLETHNRDEDNAMDDELDPLNAMRIDRGAMPKLNMTRSH